jgi:hypothetical protein
MRDRTAGFDALAAIRCGFTFRVAFATQICALSKHGLTLQTPTLNFTKDEARSQYGKDLPILPARPYLPAIGNELDDFCLLRHVHGTCFPRHRGSQKKPKSHRPLCSGSMAAGGTTCA